MTEKRHIGDDLRAVLTAREPVKDLYRRGKPVRVYLTVAEHADLVAAAHAAGLRMSEYAVASILDRLHQDLADK